MLVTPTRIGDLSLRGRHSIQSFFIFIKNESIRVIADRVCLDLNAFAQSLFQHRQQLFFFYAQKTFAVGRIAVRREQRRAPRAERAIRNYFDRSKIETIIKRLVYWSLAQ